MGYPGRVRPRLLVIRVKYNNNYGHKIPKYVKDPYDRDNLDIVTSHPLLSIFYSLQLELKIIQCRHHLFNIFCLFG